MGEMTYEYRVGFRLDDTAPRGAGVFYTAPTTLDQATKKRVSLERERSWRGDRSSYQAIWMERRPIGSWEPVSPTPVEGDE